jgi:hypothetical protein
MVFTLRAISCFLFLCFASACFVAFFHNVPCSHSFKPNRVSELEYAKAEEDNAALRDSEADVGGLNDKDIYNLLEGSGAE